MTKLTREAVAEHGLSPKIADRCKNFFAMGLVYWLFGRSLDPTLRFIEDKFGKKPEVAAANVSALCGPGGRSGRRPRRLAKAIKSKRLELPPGKYRNIMGNQALAWGLIAAAKLSGKDLFYGTYPITPASDILHELTKYKNFGVRTFQAEDEIAAVCATIGAAFGGTWASPPAAARASRSKAKRWAWG